MAQMYVYGMIYIILFTLHRS